MPTRSELTVTALEITAHRDDGKTPARGDVAFSDGKTYRFVVKVKELGGGIAFLSRRFHRGDGNNFLFSSKPRERVVLDYLSSLKQ